MSKVSKTVSLFQKHQIAHAAVDWLMRKEGLQENLLLSFCVCAGGRVTIDLNMAFRMTLDVIRANYWSLDPNAPFVKGNDVYPFKPDSIEKSVVGEGFAGRIRMDFVKPFVTRVTFIQGS